MGEWLKQCEEKACAKSRGEKWRDRCNEAVANAHVDPTQLRSFFYEKAAPAAPKKPAAAPKPKPKPKPKAHH